MLGAKAASADKDGKTEDLWDIMDRMSKPGKEVKPTSDLHEKELLKVKYGVFLDQCHKQREYRDSVDAVVRKWTEAGGKGEAKETMAEGVEKNGTEEKGNVNTKLPSGL